MNMNFPFPFNQPSEEQMQEQYMDSGMHPAQARLLQAQQDSIYMGQQPSLTKDPEVLIRLYSIDPELRKLITALSGKMYDVSTKKYYDGGTRHINDIGLLALIPFLQMRINNNATKGRYSVQELEDMNFTLRIRLAGWLARNRKNFAIPRDSISFVSENIANYEREQLSRGLDGKETDNLTQHVISHNDGQQDKQRLSYFEALTRPARRYTM